MYKRLSVLCIGIITIMSVVCSCGKLNKSMSGTYDIEDFLNIVAPADEAGEKARNADSSASWEEKSRLYFDAYQEKMRKIGFAEGDIIILNGKIAVLSPSEEYVRFSLTDESHTDYVQILGAYDDIGWTTLLPDNSNVQIEFEVIYLSDDNGYKWLDFENAKILAPSKIAYEPDCNIHEQSSVIAMGRVTNIYTFELSEHEIQKMKEEAFDNYAFDEIHYYSAMERASEYLIIEDDNGYKVGVFVDEKYEHSVDIGDKIGCCGSSYHISMGDDFPNIFINSASHYYVFD